MVSSSLLHRVAALVLTSGIAASAQEAPASAVQAPQAPQATFRSAVEVVTVSASVRTGGGKVVRDLEQADFEVLDTGKLVTIRDFYAAEGPISLALLLDISGSMDVSRNIERAREAVGMVLTSLRTGSDEAAMFTFDNSLRMLLTSRPTAPHPGGLAGKPGSPRLRRPPRRPARAQRSTPPRARLVITDGVDTVIKLTAPRCRERHSRRGRCSVAVVNPSTIPMANSSARATRGQPTGALVDSFALNGGNAFFQAVPSHAARGASLVAECASTLSP